MQVILWVYLGGIAVRTVLAAFMLANPNLQSGVGVDRAFINVVMWPLLFPFSLIKWWKGKI